MTSRVSEKEAGPTAWHARPVADAVREFAVEPTNGLALAEAGDRLERDGRNVLADAPKEPRWRAFLRQFQDLLIIILLLAAVVSLVVSREPLHQAPCPNEAAKHRSWTGSYTTPASNSFPRATATETA